MALQTKCTKLIKCKLVVHTPVKFVSKYVPKNKSAKVIRQTFIDYFKNEHNYTFVPSSPVIPFCDPSVPFVNAGMNQVICIKYFKLLYLCSNSLKGYFLALRLLNTKKLPIHKNAYELEVSTMISMKWERMDTITHFLKCLVIGLLENAIRYSLLYF